MICCRYRSAMYAQLRALLHRFSLLIPRLYSETRAAPSHKTTRSVWSRSSPCISKPNSTCYWISASATPDMALFLDTIERELVLLTTIARFASDGSTCFPPIHTQLDTGCGNWGSPEKVAGDAPLRQVMSDVLGTDVPS
jgi:hypothetical protein